MIQKFLYAFAAQEILALIERIDATDSVGDSSYHAAKHLLHKGQLNFIERRLVSNAIKKVARRETLVQAMNVVVFNNIEGRNRHAEQAEKADTYNPARGTGILAAQGAWERQLSQISILGNQQNYAQQLGVLR
jgi:hypothetical protein